MLPKAAGRHRLIILYSMAYRVWQRMRKYALQPIADKLRRHYGGAAAGRSATGSAWILAADAEQNVSNGRHTVHHRGLQQVLRDNTTGRGAG